MPLRYRLLALDIDGTLVNSQDELAAPTRAALRRARDAGLRIVLATGRRYSRALPLVAPLGIDAPLITASGALVKRPVDHATLFRAELPREVLLGLLAVVAAHGFEPILYADSFAEGFDFYCVRRQAEQPELAEYLALNPDCEREWPRLLTDPPPGVFAGFAIGSRPQMESLHAALQAALPERLYTHVLRSPRYQGYMCEIAPAGITKGFGVAWLAEQWGIRPEEICAVGDDVNDIPMFELAGLAVAMGNAQAEAKAAADWVVSSHDEHGLVEVVERLLAERDA